MNYNSILFSLRASQGQSHDTISDKPEKMVKYENAPRPDGVSPNALVED
jgi:hypothetical protein